MVQIYTFSEHNMTVSGEKHDLLRLAEVLRNEEGTLGDLRFQIEVAFDIDGLGSGNEEAPLIAPAKDIAASTPDTMVRKSISSVMAAIYRAKDRGLHDTCFAPSYHEVYDTVKREFENKGYWFKPTGVVGGVRQLSEQICW